MKLNPAEYGLNEKEVQPIENAFMPKIIERDGLRVIYESVITKELSPALCEEAGSLRRKLVKVRTGIAEIHKTQKAYFLAAGRYVDAWKNKETLPVEQMEEKLKEIEDYYENIERERKAKLKAERTAELLAFDVDGSIMSLEEMSDDVWNNYLAGVKLQYNARKEEEKKIEELRVAEAEAERKRQAELVAENERLRAEREKIVREQEAERKRLETERAEADKKRMEAEAKLAAAKKAEEDAKRKAEEEAREIERKRLLAEKKQAAAPDKEKLIKLSSFLLGIELPTVKTPEAQYVLDGVKQLLEKTSNYILDKANSL